MYELRRIITVYTLASVFSQAAGAQELPSWETFQWDQGGNYYDNVQNHYCTEIPLPPFGWIPDCSIRETESGDFLIYNQLLKQREEFGYDKLSEPPVVVDTNYMAYRA